MTLLIVGILLWVLVHFFKRLAPDMRAGMDSKLGAGPARGIIAVLLILSVVLMVKGFRSEEFSAVYTPFPSIGHLNNLLMLGAIFLFGAGNSKGKARAWLRHPMLAGAIVWSVAHLLVNGDLGSIILFGSIGIWAIAQMALINRAEGPWQRPEPGPIAGDIKLVVITLVLFGIITAVHNWLGYSPFLGTYT